MATQPIDATALFIGQAAKHFVALVCKVAMQGQPETQIVASCFVIETAGMWFLVTAGHVIEEFRGLARRGARLSGFALHEKLAGHHYPSEIPFAFVDDEWTVIESESEGSDYATTVLSPISAESLRAGGIRPLSRQSWGQPPLQAYEHWLLAGIPRESVKASMFGRTAKFTILVLAPCEKPSHLPQLTNRVYARILSTQKDKAVVEDIAGMSGGPIFGVKLEKEGLRYWVIGIQSSWQRSARVISFCPAMEFFDAVRIAVEKVGPRNA